MQMLSPELFAQFEKGFNAGIQRGINNGFGMACVLVKVVHLGTTRGGNLLEAHVTAPDGDARESFKQVVESVQKTHLETAGIHAGLAASEWANITYHRMVRAANVRADAAGTDETHQKAHELVRQWLREERIGLDPSSERKLILLVAKFRRNGAARPVEPILLTSEEDVLTPAPRRRGRPPASASTEV